jgi:hypothetical protein
MFDKRRDEIQELKQLQHLQEMEMDDLMKSVTDI